MAACSGYVTAFCCWSMAPACKEKERKEVVNWLAAAVRTLTARVTALEVELRLVGEIEGRSASEGSPDRCTPESWEAELQAP